MRLMIEAVNNRTFYHVTSTAPYKGALVMGQAVEAGGSSNPFFHFYEGVREYPVPQADGTIVMVKAIAVLKSVVDGVNSVNDVSAFARVALEVARHYQMLARELIMEEVRLQVAPDAPSRQRCLWLAETREEAEGWRLELGSGEICTLSCSGTILRVDSRLMLIDSEPLSATRERAARYWRGEVSESPRMETLFVGDARVVAVN